MTGNLGKSSSTNTLAVREELNPITGVLGTLAIGVETMIALGLSARPGVPVSNGDLRD